MGLPPVICMCRQLGIHGRVMLREHLLCITAAGHLTQLSMAASATHFNEYTFHPHSAASWLAASCAPDGQQRVGGACAHQPSQEADAGKHGALVHKVDQALAHWVAGLQE